MPVPFLGAPISLSNPTTSLPFQGAPVSVIGLGSIAPPPAPKWLGSMGFAVAQANVSQWTSNMHAGDWANIGLGTDGGAGNHTPIFTATMALLGAAPGHYMANFPDTGPATGPTTRVTNATLVSVDTALQAARGAIQEFVVYGDENVSGTAAQKITNMQSQIDILRGVGNCPDTGVPFVRANSAPAFKVCYIPSGVFIDNNINTQPALATKPDAILYQSQIHEDQPDGANAAYIATVTTILNALQVQNSALIVATQVQMFSKSNFSVVWTPTKIIQDINAIGLNSMPTPVTNPGFISCVITAAGVPASAQTNFAVVLANYRP